MDDHPEVITFQSGLKKKWYFVFIGIAFCLLIGFGLSKSEQHYKSKQALESGMLSDIREVQSSAIDSSNEGELVYIQGMVTTNQMVVDTVTQVSTEGLGLKRKVKMYQLVETPVETRKRKYGPKSHGERHDKYETITTYKYEGQWHTELMPSDQFNDEYKRGLNPKSFPLESAFFPNGSVQLGDYVLSESHLEKANGLQSLTVEDFDLDEIRKKHSGKNVYIKEKSNRFPDRVFIGLGSLESPRVGDLLISYEMLPEGEFSVIGTQENGQVVPFSSNGSTIALMKKGNVNPQEMLASFNQISSFLTWLVRGLALFFMCLAYLLAFLPFKKVNTGVMGTVMKSGLFVVALVATLITMGLILQLA